MKKNVPGRIFHLAGAALLGVVVFLVLGGQRDLAPWSDGGAAREEASSAAAVGVAAPARTAADGEARTDVPAAVPSTDALVHPFAYELACRVVDADGLPVPRARVSFAPAGCCLNQWPERTGDDGSVCVTWHARREAMPIVVEVESGSPRTVRRLEVRAGRTEVVFGGEAPGRQTAGTLRFVMTSSNARGGGLELRGVPVGTSARRSILRDGLHPGSSFSDFNAPLKAVPMTGSGLQQALMVGQEVKFVMQAASGPAAAKEPDAAPPTRLAGVVYGEDGALAADVSVTWGRERDLPLGRTRTDAQGQFAFDDVTASGFLELRAGGGDGGLRHERVLVHAGQENRWNPALQRQETILGRALGATGEPLAGWTVELEGGDVPWFDECRVRDDGSFELPNLPGGTYRLLLWPKDGERGLPTLVRDGVRGGGGEVVLRLAPAKGALRVTPRLPRAGSANERHGRPEVWAFSLTAGRGARLARADGGAFALGDLPAGHYEVEIGVPGLGWVAVGRHWVDGQGATDLGDVAIPAPATLHVRGDAASLPAAEARRAELWARRADADVRVDEVRGGSDETTLQAPAGDCFWLWRDRDGELRWREVALQAGGEVTLDCR